MYSEKVFYGTRWYTLGGAISVWEAFPSDLNSLKAMDLCNYKVKAKVIEIKDCSFSYHQNVRECIMTSQDFKLKCRYPDIIINSRKA